MVEEPPNEGLWPPLAITQLPAPSLPTVARQEVQLYLGGMPLDPAAHQLRAVHRMPVHDQVHPAWRTERPAALLTVVVAGAPSPKLRLLLDGLAAGQPLSFYSTP